MNFVFADEIFLSRAQASSEEKNYRTGTDSDMDMLRLQLEAKFAQDLENEKKRLFDASLSVIQHAEQKVPRLDFNKTKSNF